MANFRFPDHTKRTSIIGRTGSGKSVLGVWLLANQDIDRRPWLIIDHKGEKMFRQLDRRAIRELKPGARVPRNPGLYLTNPLPGIDDKAIEDTLWRIWEDENTGVYIDEATTMPDCYAFDTLMVQGRSLKVPMIVCSQRPIGISPVIFTQSDFFAVFNIQRRKDQLIAEDYLNLPKVLTEKLPEHHAVWHDVSRDSTMVLTPCPHPDHVVETLNSRAPHRYWW